MQTGEIIKADSPIEEGKKAEEDFFGGSFEELEKEARNAQGHVRRYIITMDATGSMASYWTEGIKAMQLVADKVFQKALVPVEVQVIAYRDFCDGHELLTISNWSNDKEYLKNFIANIRCHGGGDEPEALWAVLDNVVQQIHKEQKQIHKIVLIGDAPDHHEQGHDAVDPATELGKHKAPCYCFYTHTYGRVVSSFKRIAEASGGFAGPLTDIHNMSDIIATLLSQDKVLGIEYVPTSKEGQDLKDKLDKESK